MSTVWIRVVYAGVIGVLVAFTTIFGVLMVAPGPEKPGDPGVTFRQLSGDGDDERSQSTLQNQIENYYGEASKFRADFPGWQRNVFLAVTGLAILFVLIGLALPAVVNYLRLGMVGGGLLAMLWAFQVASREAPAVVPTGSNLLIFLGAGFAEPLDFAGRFSLFAVSFIGLILALFLGLWRLTEWSAPTRRPAPARAPAAPATTSYAPPAAPAAAAPVAAAAAAAPAASPWAPPAAPPAPASATPAPAAEVVVVETPAESNATAEWKRAE